jgi:hypothetical protein
MEERSRARFLPFAPLRVGMTTFTKTFQHLVREKVMEELAEKRDTILEKWLEQTLASYPSQTARFLRNENDRFHNPVGHTLKEGLATLLDEISGEMDAAKIRPALESIVRLRAVQDFTAAQATGFVFALREILSDNLEGGGPPTWQKRIDEVALLAFDLYMKCREAIHEIKAQERQREVYVWERMNQRAQHCSPKGSALSSRG